MLDVMCVCMGGTTWVAIDRFICCYPYGLKMSDCCTSPMPASQD
jgi:hypothetical protein